MFILAKIVGIIVAMVYGGESEQGAKNDFIIGEGVVRVFNWLIDTIVTIFVAISVMIAQDSRRKNELMADSFSASLGYRQPMIQFFEKYGNSHVSNKMLSISYLLYGSHSSTQVRINNLRRD